MCFFYGTYVELENFDYMSIVVQLRKYLYSVFPLLRPRAFCALSWSHSNIFPCPTLLRANSSSNGLMKGFSWLTKYLSPLGLKGFEPKCERILDWTTTQCSCWLHEMGWTSFFMSLWEHQVNVMAGNHYGGGCCAFCGYVDFQGIWKETMRLCLKNKEIILVKFIVSWVS